MHAVAVENFDEWRAAARAFLAKRVPPEAADFRVAEAQRRLFDEEVGRVGTLHPRPLGSATTVVHRVPRNFVALARRVACHSHAERFAVLYRVLWRLLHGEPYLLKVATDDDIHRLLRWEKSVRRDAHKMKAFVRFRKVVSNGDEHFVAWHRPDHRIVRLTAPFFSRRFRSMHWTIFTPHESACWDLQELEFGRGIPASEGPQADELEDLWRTYYGSIFNPARIKFKAMIREMPVRHWKTLPETDVIHELLRDAPERVDAMIERQDQSHRSAAEYVPTELLGLDALRAAAATCQGCDLHCDAKQTVFGEGPTDARVMLVGEQPGDQEDFVGRPFVGPAGSLLREVLAEAGLSNNGVYLTNTVKHFKYVLRGKRRLHKKPLVREVNACTPWLHAEVEVVRPAVIVCLGATAAQALIGRDFRVTQQRGEFFPTRWCAKTIATYHPSAVLRARNDEQRLRIRGALLADLSAAQRSVD